MKAVLYDYGVTNRKDLLQRYLTTDWQLSTVPDLSDDDRIRTGLAGVDAFVGNVFTLQLRKAAGEGLKLIHSVGAGVDAIQLEAIPPGCTLCNVFEHDTPMAEHVMLTILLFVTRIDRYQASFRRGEWQGSGRFDGEFHDEAAGKTLGLIGFGHIGRAVATRAKAFGMKVAAVARRPRNEPTLDWYGPIHKLNELLEMSDFIAVVCPLTPETRGMIGKAQLRRLRPSACLINVSRAEVIQEEPLYRALSEKWFSGAALDVWYQYPSRPGVAQHGSRLPFHELDNVILTPHFSAWTEQLIHRRYHRIAENLDRLARAEPLESVVHRGA